MLTRHPFPFMHATHKPAPPMLATQTNRNLETYIDPYDPTLGVKNETFSDKQRTVSVRVDGWAWACARACTRLAWLDITHLLHIYKADSSSWTHLHPTSILPQLSPTRFLRYAGHQTYFDEPLYPGTDSLPARQHARPPPLNHAAGITSADMRRMAKQPS